MSARGKRKGDDNYASDGDSDGNAPPKKSAKQDDEDGIVVCEISKNRRVSVREWQGRVFVDIREFYVKDGKQMPGKKVQVSHSPWISGRFFVNMSRKLTRQLPITRVLE